MNKIKTLALAVMTVVMVACGASNDKSVNVGGKKAISANETLPAGMGGALSKYAINSNIPGVSLIGSTLNATFTPISGGAVGVNFPGHSTTTAFSPITPGNYNFAPSAFTLTTLSGVKFTNLVTSSTFTIVAGQVTQLPALILSKVLGADVDGDGWHVPGDQNDNDPCTGRVLNDLVGQNANCPLPSQSGGSPGSITLTTTDVDGDFVDAAHDPNDNDPCNPDPAATACVTPPPPPVTGTTVYSNLALAEILEVNLGTNPPVISNPADLAVTDATLKGFHASRVVGPAVASDWNNKWRYQIKVPIGAIALNQPLTRTIEYYSAGAGFIYAEIANPNPPYSMVDSCFTSDYAVVAGVKTTLTIVCTSDTALANAEFRIQIGGLMGSFTYGILP